MSYFIASHTSINKKDETITFTGWDSNVQPRPRYKCKPISFRWALIELAWRWVHFGTNNDLHYFLDETVVKINNEFGRYPSLKYANDTEWLWDYLNWYSVKTPELDAKAEKAIEDFRQACLSYVPDKDLYFLRNEDWTMIRKSTSTKIWMTRYDYEKKLFKWYRMAKACFACKQSYGFVPVKYEG